MNDIYTAPESDLEAIQKSEMSAREKHAESRRQMDEASARRTMNVVWGLRLIGDILILIAFIFMFNGGGLSTTGENKLALLIIFAFPIAEMICIAGYFMDRGWCRWPLHIFSAFSLLNIPIGTLFSILHYFNMRKIRFKYS